LIAARGLVEDRGTLSKDWRDLVNDPEIKIVGELMGGIDPVKSLEFESMADRQACRNGQ
jgi:hypothetical protein